MAKPRTTHALREVILQCKHKDWAFRVLEDDGGPYLQLHFEAPCSVTGVVQPWTTRKWRLSPYMTDSELVTTAFKAVVTAVEHEAREHFRYNGRAIFGPHIDVNELWQIANMLDIRED